jgi:hypothetical protein
MRKSNHDSGFAILSDWERARSFHASAGAGGEKQQKYCVATKSCGSWGKTAMAAQALGANRTSLTLSASVQDDFLIGPIETANIPAGMQAA